MCLVAAHVVISLSTLDRVMFSKCSTLWNTMNADCCSLSFFSNQYLLKDAEILTILLVFFSEALDAWIVELMLLFTVYWNLYETIADHIHATNPTVHYSAYFTFDDLFTYFKKQILCEYFIWLTIWIMEFCTCHQTLFYTNIQFDGFSKIHYNTIDNSTSNVF